MKEETGRYILVIDDQRGVRLLLLEVFKGMGIPVRITASGPEAVAVARDGNPSLVLVDMKMPVMDGLDTIIALRAVGILAPCHLMTALGPKDSRVEAALRITGVSLLAKPFDIATVRKVALQMGAIPDQPIQNRTSSI